VYPPGPGCSRPALGPWPNRFCRIFMVRGSLGRNERFKVELADLDRGRRGRCY
jgi:hypothetical protein